MFPRLSGWVRSTLGLALAGAAIFWLALPPCDFWPLGWMAPMPWIVLIRRRELAGKRPYATLWLTWFLFWLAAVYWLLLPHPATSVGWLALSGYLAFYLPVFVGLVRVAVHRLRISVILAAPVVWAGLELAEAHLLTGFSMGNLSHTQHRWITLIQVSDLAGAYTVSFVIMFVAACLVRMLPSEDRPATLWPLAPLLAMLSAVLWYGHERLQYEEPAAAIHVALIQGSIDIELDANPERAQRMLSQYRELSLAAVRSAGWIDLVAWPESAFPCVLIESEGTPAVPDFWNGSEAAFLTRLEQIRGSARNAFKELAIQIGKPCLVGTDTERFGPEGIRSFNTAAMVSASGEVVGCYDKMHLVLFGEYVPFADWFPWLQKFTPLPASAASGQTPMAFDVGPLRVAPNICYESVIPHVIRGQVCMLTEEGRCPDVLVNLTNDGWFWGSSELEMHLACGVFRAVECRKPFLIAANTGISAWIDADGRILDRGKRRQTGTIVASVGLDPRKSWYLVCGDWPVGLCLSATIGLAIFGFWDRRRRSGTIQR